MGRSNLHPEAEPEKYRHLVKEAGVKLQRIMQERGMTVEDVAGFSGLSHVTVTLIRCGNSSAGIITYMRLADGLGISLSELFDTTTPINQQVRRE